MQIVQVLLDFPDRNIQDLTNAFNVQSPITRDNYTLWYEALKVSSPAKVDQLKLKQCDLQNFVDQVLHSL